MPFKEINIREIQKSAVSLISDDWALVTAGNKSAYNAMTISWGGLGELWGKDVAFVFIRPQRYTREFVDNAERFTLSFFNGKYKKELGFFGSKSGRDFDKFAETGLRPVFIEDTVAVEQADYILICRKLAVSEIKPKDFIDKTIEDNYKQKDYHKIYIVEIERCLQSQN